MPIVAELEPGRPVGAAASGQTDWQTVIPPVIVGLAVLFNPLLAIVNANVRPLTPSVVIGCEILVVIAAHAYAAAHYDRRMLPWYGLLGFVLAFAVVRSTATGVLEIRYVRDLLMVPTFVVLGITANERGVVACLVCLQAVVVGCVALEAIAVDAYSALFQVKDYYINTRGIAAGEFTNEASSLFVSATRPDLRFFPFFDLHRLSSVFLEPVSLGNFAIIIVCFTMAFWRRLALWQRLFLPASVLVVLFACDGRLSAIASCAVIGMGLVARLLPRNVALLFLPLVTALTVAVSLLGEFKTGTDDLPGRLAHTQHWLSEMWISDVLGASDRLRGEAEDSGLIYLLISQSLLGLVIFWCMVVLKLDERSSAHQLYKNGICLYLSLTAMISFAFISIKTAAPLWLVYGFLIAAGPEQGRPRVAGGPAPAA